MKVQKLNWLFSLMASTLLYFFPNPALAGLITEEITKEITVPANAVIYGKQFGPMEQLELIPWEKNIAKQVVKVSISAVDEKTAQALINALNIDLKKTWWGNIELDLNLNIDSQGKINTNNIQTPPGQTAIVLSNGQHFFVNHFEMKVTVYLPMQNALDLESNFSNLSLGNFKSVVKMKLNNVNLKANVLDNLELNAAFSQLSMHTVNTATIQAKNSAFNITQLKTGTISSTFSKYFIEEAHQLDIAASTNDTYQINTIQTISSSNSTFTNYQFGHLYKRMNIVATNGDVSLNNLAPNFEELTLHNKFSTIKVNVHDLPDFRLTNTSTFTEVSYCEPLNQTNESSASSKQYFKGKPDSNHHINITCNNCNISFF